jgi:hypothetical protein
VRNAELKECGAKQEEIEASQTDSQEYEECTIRVPHCEKRRGERVWSKTGRD